MIKNQAIGGKSNKALIFLGLFLGVVSAVLVVVYLSSADSGGSGEVSDGVGTPVVVASQNIAAGTRITEEMVSVKEISGEAVLAGVYEDSADVVGQVTRVPLVPGEQVIPTKVTATGAAIVDVENPALAYVVPEGKRGVSVRVSNVIGASGLIRPGDYVDVILTIKIESGDETSTTSGTRDQIARTILQNAQVLSIDQDVAVTAIDQGSEGSPAVEGETESNPDAATVTLAVSPIHGEVLTAAEACGENFNGRLALSLRAFGDSSNVGTRSVWANNGAPPTCSGILGLTELQ